MKKLLFLLMLPFLMVSCKKSSSNTAQAPINIVVTRLTAATSLSIKIVDNTSGRTIYNKSNQFGNQTYTTPDINVGDKLSVTVTANVNDDASADGEGNVSFMFQDEAIGSYFGVIGTTGFAFNMNAEKQTTTNN